jgi:hypothetical protein
LRVAIALAARASPPHYSVRISTRELQRLTRLATSAVNRGIRELCDPKHAYVAVRRGTATVPSAYLLSFVQTVRGASFREAPAKEAPPLLFEQQPASFAEAPPAENAPVNATFAAVDVDAASLQLIDRVLSAKTSDFDPNLIRHFRSWLHGYMCKLGRDANNRPLSNPHPPPDDLVAQLLALAEPRRLEGFLDGLMAERQACQTYAWFVVVGLQRIHGIAARSQKQARAALKLVRAGGRAEDPEWRQQTIEAIASIARAKKLR